MSTDISYFYNGPEPLLRILVVGTLAYAFLLLSVRASGARTLAKMNAFDFIITVGFGAAFGRVLLDKSVSLSEGIVSFLLLIGLQFAVSFGRLQWKWFRKIVDMQPVLLYYRGQYISDVMKRSRVCKTDVEGAIRHHSEGSLENVEAVVLEASGHLAVILKSDSGAPLAAKLAQGKTSNFVANVASTTPY